ncbi:hypothetical protein Q1695_002551 [Nippostrongylus brasiliensis]|nr:hypothetical protein Q1695_002551 [Nippostrongylus brasiliensis]
MMLAPLLLLNLVLRSYSGPVTGGPATGAPSSDPDEEIRKKLIYPGSPDTIENRRKVKEMLGSLNLKTQNFHRAGDGDSTASPPPKPNNGPKNNFSKPITETNKGKSKRAAITDPTAWWNPAVPINYTFDSSLTSDVVALIRQGLKYWQSNTCLSFTENPYGANRLRFYAGEGCWGYVGKQPTWPSQDISIGAGCNNLGTVTHEIAHSLGFYHTQSRYDRDSWINVYMGNVDPTLQYNFAKMTQATETHWGQPYDYGSVMQYDPYAFAENPSDYTMVARNMAYTNTMGQREAPAFSDVRDVNYLYNCSSRCQYTPVPPCRKPGYQDPLNCYSCKCPRYFGGQYCETLPAGTAKSCNGKVVQATTASWTTLNGTAGDPNNYDPQTNPDDCYWHITAPAGRKIQVRLSTAPSNCMEGCPWQSLEINLGQFDLYGMIMCCATAAGQTYTSTGNMVAIRGTVRYNQLTFGMDYRLV